MKSLLALFVAVLTAGTLSAQEMTFGASALQAIDLAEAALPENNDARLVEMRATRGRPGPESWILLYSDPSSPTGIRLVQVKRGKVSKMETPSDAYYGVRRGTPLRLDRLRLDAGDAHYKAMQRSNAEHTQVSYVLNQRRISEAPIWKLSLQDSYGQSTGVIEVDAASGAVESVGDVYRLGEPVPTEEPIKGSRIRRETERVATETAEDTEDRFLTIGNQLEGIFTGRQTLLEDE